MKQNALRLLMRMLLPLVLSVGVSWSSVAQGHGTVANLIPNPSFEEQTKGNVLGWKSRAWQGETDGRWTVESPGRTGKQCVSIRSEKGTDAAWTTTVTVHSNSFYRLSGWIKTKDIRGAVGALLNIQNLQAVRSPRVTGTKNWTPVSTVFYTGKTTALEINCLFGGWGESTGQAWYDDVALEQLPDPSSEEPQASVTINTDAPSVPYSPMLFGGFIEHFDGQIYGGLFEPGSPPVGRTRFPQGCHRGVEGVEALDCALAGRMFRERLSLAGRCREVPQANCRSRVGRRGPEHIRHR
jgi:hypothetical protein